MKQSLLNKKKQSAIPTQQDFEHDRFYYNTAEDTREALSEVRYTHQEDEEYRVSKYW